MMEDLKLEKSFEAEGWIIRYGVFGEEAPTGGKTILFIHGTPWSSEVFKPLAKALLSLGGYRIVLYDLGGYGVSQQRSDTSEDEKKNKDEWIGGTSSLYLDLSQNPHLIPQTDTSVRTQSLILTTLFTTLHLSNPLVLAHDIAGSIALRASLIHNLTYKSLLLLDTNAILPWGDGFYTLVRTTPSPFLALPPPIFDAMLRAVIRSATVKPIPRQLEDALARPWTGEGGQRAFVRQIAQASDEDVREMMHLYGELGCTVKILWGDGDTWIPGEKVEKLAGMLGGKCEGVGVVEGAGHLVMVDAPERVAMEVLEWVRRS